jgi:microcystin-dependent protein
MTAEGQLLSISQNQGLFSLLGNAYGGDGQTTFALPDLDGRTMVGRGEGFGLPELNVGERMGSESVTLTATQLPGSVGGGGQPFDNHQPSVAVTYLIDIAGTVPTVQFGTAASISSERWCRSPEISRPPDFLSATEPS